MLIKLTHGIQSILISKMNWLNKHPIAHRGLHYDDIYENTKESFQAAIKQNYTIECDVVLTKDHEVAVFHD